jgi:hypothetical protein
MSKRTAAGKARTVAKSRAHVKPAAARGKTATGHAAKHHKAAKHHAAPKKHKGTVARGLAPAADQVASCAAEALAASLRHLQLPGLSVSGADVLALHRAAGACDDAGAPILAVLEAASEFRLAGYRPVFDEVMPSAPGHNDSRHTGFGLRASRAGLILGVDLPGPHTVLATPEGWWSWGELFCPWCEFPDVVVEEAWEVTWR